MMTLQCTTDCIKNDFNFFFFFYIMSIQQKLYTPCPWSWLQLEVYQLKRTAQFSRCPPVVFIPDLVPKGYMTPLFKFLTEQHGVEAPVYSSIQSELQQIVICGGCICEERPRFVLSLQLNNRERVFHKQPFIWWAY